MSKKKATPKKKPAIKIVKKLPGKKVAKKPVPKKKTIVSKSMQDLMYGNKQALKHIKGVANTVIKSKHDGTKTAFTFDNVELELTDKQTLFCMMYVQNNFNGTKAAKLAGYAENSADVQAARLLENDSIKRLIELLKKDIGLAIGVSAYDIAKEYAKIGFINPKKWFNADGGIKNIHDIDDDAACAIGSIQIDELYEYANREKIQIGFVKKIRPHNKVDALDKLAKMIGADGVTKIAAVDKDGNDVTPPPLTDLQVDKILNEVRKIKK